MRTERRSPTMHEDVAWGSENPTDSMRGCGPGQSPRKGSTLRDSSLPSTGTGRA